jgi:hypothetical protein
VSKTRNTAKQQSFLAAFVATASITKAAEAAKIHRQRHYTWLEDDPHYPALFEHAKTEASQSLEDEAVRRAHEGVLEPVFYKGKPAGVVRVYSDGLLQTLLKGWLPEKYRDRANVEVSAPGGGPILLEDKRFSNLTDDELAALIATARKIEAGLVKLPRPVRPASDR